jgi:hypothetical protein
LARVQAAQLVVVVGYWHRLVVEVLGRYLDRAEAQDFEELGFVVLGSALGSEVLDSEVPGSAVLDPAARDLAAEAAEPVLE